MPHLEMPRTWCPQRGGKQGARGRQVRALGWMASVAGGSRREDRKTDSLSPDCTVCGKTLFERPCGARASEPSPCSGGGTHGRSGGWPGRRDQGVPGGAGVCLSAEPPLAPSHCSYSSLHLLRTFRSKASGRELDGNEHSPFPEYHERLFLLAPLVAARLKDRFVINAVARA